MKIRQKVRIGIMVAVSAILCTFGVSQAFGASENKALSATVVSYEMKDNNNYEYGEATPVSTMSYGKAAIGALEVNGLDIEKTSYKGKQAFGTSSVVSFSYVYDNKIVDGAEDEWHIVSDKEKKFNGQKLDANIGKGLLLIQKSADGVAYENVTNPIVDFFASNKSGNVLYTTAGEDISKGMYYRVLLAYKTEKQVGKTLWLFDKLEEKRHVEVYEFFVVENSGQISIHNLSVDEELLEMEDFSQELLKQGETLEDGSITRDGFQIKSFTESYSVMVQRKGGALISAKNGEQFKADGKYTITVKTLLGKKIEHEIFVFKGGVDKGYSTYFGDGLVQAERVFRNVELPTYARGGRVYIQAVPDNVPVLYGSIVNLESGETVFELDGTRNAQEFPLSPGAYGAILYNMDQDVAGSYYCYTFKFNVLDEESAPYVNYHNLMATERLEDLKSKHYEVAYQTTGGGYIYVCFSMDSYDEALEYAREIEGRFVEEASDGGYYYKDIENANRKIKYYDLYELTAAREHYAKQNVEVNYFNALDEFSYRTYNDDLLACLEDLNLTESIKVFPSQEEKDKLIERMLYINDFTFIQASDYDVEKVEACHKETGEITALKFDIPVSKQLKKSGAYTITETNCYGKTTVYDTYFITECNTEMEWVVTTNGSSETIKIGAESMDADNCYTIVADSAYVSDIANSVDSSAIVTIKAPEVYSFEIKCLASEFKNLEFFKAGEYEIKFIDRLGNFYTVKLAITGNTPYSALQAFNASYVTFYNGLYTNPKETDEDILLLSEIVVKEEPEDVGDGTEYLDEKQKEEPTGEGEEEIIVPKAPEEKDSNVGVVILIICVVIALSVGVVIACKKKSGAKKIEAHDDREDV